MVLHDGDNAGEENSSRRMLLLTLTQHRVAWLEQIVLRIKGVPHVVLNSPYSFCEATGPLPFVQSYDCNLKHSFLVGRTNPSIYCYDASTAGENSNTSPGCSGSDILLYLRMEHNVDLDCDLALPTSSNTNGGGEVDEQRRQLLVSKLTTSQRSDRLAYLSLIREELHPILQVIRYCDEVSYNTCHLPTSRQLMLCCNGNRVFPSKKGLFTTLLYHPLHYLQSFLERSRALSKLRRHSVRSYCWGNIFPTTTTATWGEQLNLYAAIAHIDEIYAGINDRLVTTPKGQQQKDEQPTFLLGTSYPTNVDAALFAHLAEAITDIHILPILSQYEALITFFRYMFNTYFGPNYRFPATSHGAEDATYLEELVKSNNVTNYVNASGASIYNTIQSDLASLLWLNLDKESLWEAAAAQHQQQQNHYNNLGGGETIHRWLMEGGIFPPDEEKMYGPSFRVRRKRAPTEDAAANAQHNTDDTHQQQKMESLMEKLQQERKNDDILWLSCIAATLVGAIIISRQ
jgi:hypothetical protein